MNAGSIGKKSLKVAGAACAATGIVAASALVASGAAVGAVMEGFLAARKAVIDILKKEAAASSEMLEGNEMESVEKEG